MSEIIFLYLQHIKEIRISREPFLLNGDWAVFDDVIKSLNLSLAMVEQNGMDTRRVSGLVTAIRGMGLWAYWMDMWFDSGCKEEGCRNYLKVDGVKARLKRELDEMRFPYWLDY